MNGRLGTLNSEISRLGVRQKELEIWASAGVGRFEEAEAIARTWGNFAEALAACGADTELRRQFVKTHVKTIQRTEGGFDIQWWLDGGSANQMKWHPQADSNRCCRDENPVS